MRAVDLTGWLAAAVNERLWLLGGLVALLLMAGLGLGRRRRAALSAAAEWAGDSAPSGLADDAPWAAKTVVSPKLAVALIGAQFSDLAPVRVAPLGVGWDNTAFLVNDVHVFRFPRREIAVPLLEAEARLLPAIAPRLPLAVPVPDRIGRPSARFSWPFLGYRFVPGRTADRAHLSETQREAAAEPLGRFLAALHGFPVDEALALGGVGDTIGRLDLAKKVPEALERLARLPAEVLGSAPDKVRSILEGSARIRAPAARVLAHGDLYVRHLLVDDAGGLCGVIDWGDLHIGNPAVDLSVAYGFLPPAARPRFLQAYDRRVAAPTWWLARFRAVFSALAILDYGRQIGDADLEREGRVSLANAVAGG